MAAIFRLVDRARSNTAHAQINISGDSQTGNYPSITQHNGTLDLYL